MSPSDNGQENGRNNGPKDTIPLSLALSIMDAFSKAGMMVVPRTPTQEMVEAGADACDGDGEKAAAIYNVMISAAR